MIIIGCNVIAMPMIMMVPTIMAMIMIAIGNGGYRQGN